MGKRNKQSREEMIRQREETKILHMKRRRIESFLISMLDWDTKRDFLTRSILRDEVELAMNDELIVADAARTVFDVEMGENWTSRFLKPEEATPEEHQQHERWKKNWVEGLKELGITQSDLFLV